MHENFPAKGFYIHYKHDPKGERHNHTYEVIGVARNTEENNYSVLYRPLYQNEWLASASYFARPLGMFMEAVLKNGEKVSRFSLITDEDVIAELKKETIRKYG